MPEDGILEISRAWPAARWRTWRRRSARPSATAYAGGRRRADAGPALRARPGQRSCTPRMLRARCSSHILNVQQRSLIRQVGDRRPLAVWTRGRGGEEITFCFADLVGFTSLGESVAGRRAGRGGGAAGGARRSRRRAAGAAGQDDRRRGDAGLARQRRAASGAATAGSWRPSTGQRDRVPEAASRAARRSAAAATGTAGPVNLPASRVTGIARPGSVLDLGGGAVAAEATTTGRSPGGREPQGRGRRGRAARVAAPPRRPATPESRGLAEPRGLAQGVGLARSAPR